MLLLCASTCIQYIFRQLIDWHNQCSVENKPKKPSEISVSLTNIIIRIHRRGRQLF